MKMAKSQKTHVLLNDLVFSEIELLVFSFKIFTVLLLFTVSKDGFGPRGEFLVCHAEPDLNPVS